MSLRPQTLMHLPNVEAEFFRIPGNEQLSGAARSTHAPRILLLYSERKESAEALSRRVRQASI